MKEYHFPLYDKLVTVIFLFQTILIGYGWVILGFEIRLSFLLNFVLGGLYLLKRINRVKNNYYHRKPFMPRALMFFFVWVIFTRLVSTCLYGDSLPITAIVSFIAFSMFFNVINYNYLLDLYKKIAVLAIVLFSIQYISKLLLGTFPAFQLPFFPSFYSYEDTISSLEKVRCFSFFLEPSHMAVWLIPLLIIYSFADKINYLKVGMLVLVLILLNSGSGMIGLSTIAILYIVSNIFLKGSFRNKLLSCILIIFGLTALSWYFSSEFGTEVLARSNSLKTGDFALEQSGFVRIVRGYMLWNKLSMFDIIFGCNSNVKIASYAAQIPGYLSDAGSDTWLNGIQSIMIYTGIVGLILMVSFVFYLWKNNSKAGKALIITWIVISFIHNNFLDGGTFLYWLLAYMTKQNNICNIHLNKIHR